jgi:hypothetical protein
MVAPRILMGEGASSQKDYCEANPTPILGCCTTELPSPARGPNSRGTVENNYVISIAYRDHSFVSSS